MDRLLTMRTFVVVARLSSFTQAADELGISRTLVSRHISDLEGHLGVRLLHRTTRAVTPTPIGYDYLALCRKVLGDIEAGEDQIALSRNEVVGEISILCPIWLGSFGLSEAAASFGVRHKGVTVRIQFEEPSSNPHEFLDREFDLCVQPAALRDSSITIKKIGEIEFCLIASRDYLTARGEPASAEQLANHDLLIKSGEANWEFASGTSVHTRENVRLSTNSVFALCSGASEGLGIALVPRAIAEPFLRDGRIRLVLPDDAPLARPLYVAFAPGGDVPRRVREFVAWLDAWFKTRDSRALPSSSPA